MLVPIGQDSVPFYPARNRTAVTNAASAGIPAGGWGNRGGSRGRRTLIFQQLDKHARIYFGLKRVLLQVAQAKAINRRLPDQGDVADDKLPVDSHVYGATIRLEIPDRNAALGLVAKIDAVVTGKLIGRARQSTHR